MLVGLKDWAKRGDSRPAQRLWRLAKALRSGAVPVVPILHRPLYALHRAVAGLLANLARAFYWTPLFQARLAERRQKNLWSRSGCSQRAV